MAYFPVSHTIIFISVIMKNLLLIHMKMKKKTLMIGMKMNMKMIVIKMKKKMKKNSL